jgi:hypothetical protein
MDMAGTAMTDTTPPAARTPGTDGSEKARSRGRRARTEGDEENNGDARYFLGKADSNGGTPALDREVASEGEALVEALRLGVTFYALQEFRVVPDFSGKKPQLNKESVAAK